MQAIEFSEQSDMSQQNSLRSPLKTSLLFRQSEATRNLPKEFKVKEKKPQMDANKR